MTGRSTRPKAKPWPPQAPTISGYQQSPRRGAPDRAGVLEAGFIGDDRRQFAGPAPTTQPIVSADPSAPAAYHSPDAVAFYNQPVPEGVHWVSQVTVRSSRAARMYEPGQWVSRMTALAVGGLRELSADDPDDPRLRALIGELCSGSA